MAIAVESTTTVGTTNNWVSSPVTLTKPTGLQEDELLVAVIVAITARTITPPAGWDTRFTDTDFSGAGTCSVGIYTKVADSSDVAASNFEFTLDANTGTGAMLRVSGISYLDDNEFFGVYDTENDVAKTPDFDGCLLVFLGSYSDDDDDNTDVTSVSINGTNPSWTQVLESFEDQTQNANEDGGGYVAYGIQNTAAEINNATSVTDPTSRLKGAAVAIIRPRVDVSVTLGTITVGAAQQSVSPSGDANATLGTATIGASPQSLSPDTPTPKWSNADKSTEPTWVNKPKS